MYKLFINKVITLFKQEAESDGKAVSGSPYGLDKLRI